MLRPPLPRVEIEEVSLRGGFPDTHLIVHYRTDRHPVGVLEFTWPLWLPEERAPKGVYSPHLQDMGILVANLMDVGATGPWHRIRP